MEYINEKIAIWLVKAQNIVNRDGCRVNPATLLTEFGKKYVRIVRIVRFREQDGQTVKRSAYAFIDLATGDVLKPDGWKRPAKRPRGNVGDEKGGLEWLTPYGVECIR